MIIIYNNLVVQMDIQLKDTIRRIGIITIIISVIGNTSIKLIEIETSLMYLR